MDPIIARMEEDLKDLDRSIHTRRVYVQTVKRFRRHVGRPLDKVALEDVREYMRRLRRSGKYQPTPDNRDSVSRTSSVTTVPLSPRAAR